MKIFIKDKIFKDDKNYPKVFKFDSSIAEVFDNMIKRSVPFYKNIQDVFCYFGRIFIKPYTHVYDLGCSTGYTIKKLSKLFPDENIFYFAVDNSADMLARAKKRLGKNDNVEYIKQDLNKKFEIKNASMVIANLVMQFLKYSARLKLLKNIYAGLNRGGAVVLVEKVFNRNIMLNRLFINKYHLFKKSNAYSNLEIKRKDNSLKNILKPLTVEENIKLLKKAGFGNVEIFFCWFNFCGFIAVK